MSVDWKRAGGVMKKQEWKAWEIVIEAVTAAAVLVFLGLQVYYAYLYDSGLMILLYHLLPVVFLYIGMTVLQRFPELLNGRGSEPLDKTVCMYAVRMVRNGKLLLILGMLVPSIADVLYIEVNAAYSLMIMAGILLNILYYFYRIFQYNSRKER